MFFRPLILALASTALFSACDAPASDRPESLVEFPLADRAIPDDPTGEMDPFPDEDAREERGEAQTVMDLASITEGMTIADIGAGEGYYTVRLATRVGEDGRVLAQDIDRDALVCSK